MGFCLTESVQDENRYYPVFRTHQSENRLIKTESAASVPDAAKVKVENLYDYLGRRVRKTVSSDYSGGSYTTTNVTTFVYDGWLPIAEITDDGGAVSTNFHVWGIDASGTLQGAGGVGGLLATIQDGEAYFACMDGNGNVCQYVDTNGTVVAHREYDPFGGTIALTGDKKDDFNLWWSTKPLDQETGLYVYTFRHYDPETGRWPSRDPIGERGGLNAYAFVRNAPIDLVDILGLTDPELGVALAIGLGWDNVTGPYISTVSLVGSAEQGLCDNLRFRGDVHVRLYSGGLGTAHGDRSTTDFGLDLTGALSATIGEGSGAGTSSYTLNYQTRSAVQNTFQNSFTWGQAWNYNSALGGTTRVGFMGLRADNFFMQYNNDVNRFPYGEGTDHGWTGGGVLGFYVGGGNSIETGFQDFTGDILGFNRRHVGDGRSRDGYYLQDQGELSLNRAEWFLRYGGSQGSATLSISSPDWLNVQHLIHDYISPSSARFEYPEFRYSLTVEGEIKAKY